MESIIWNQEDMTTITAIANHYTNGDTNLSKEIKPYIRTGLKKLDTVKLTKNEIMAEIEILEPLVGNIIPSAGLTLIRVQDVPKLEKYFSLILKQKLQGKYKKDRYYSNRTLLDEIKLELSRKNIKLNSKEFKAVLSYTARLENGQSKVKALRQTAKKFGVTQKCVVDIISSLDLQINYINKPKDFV
ncbi:hypothetical protein [Vallitalea guaymasensis]|uniref:hypothetical protein n=1 Tax=Vallitalea guaymasensis TaxID=1185412 RepID=UPI000DE26B3D|nr:hypothetical protein [Vallitalea guaymasensis]